MITISYSGNLRRTHFGALKASSTLNANEKVDVVVDVLQCPWIRTKITIFGLGGWDGSSAVYEYARSRGLKQLVVIVAYPSGSPQPFVPSVDLADYAIAFQDIITTYPETKEFVVDNEAQTPQFHSSDDMTEYGDMLQALYPVAKANGVKIYDSGLVYNGGFKVRIYQWIVTRYNQTVADGFGASEMSNHQIQYAKGLVSDTALDLQAEQIDILLSFKNYIHGFNVHFYEQPPSEATTTVSAYGLRFITEFLNALGLICISNEMGQRNNSDPTLMRNIAKNFERLGYRHAEVWDGDGSELGGARPLSDVDTGDIFDNGAAYRDEVQLRKVF